MTADMTARSTSGPRPVPNRTSSTSCRTFSELDAAVPPFLKHGYEATAVAIKPSDEEADQTSVKGSTVKPVRATRRDSNDSPVQTRANTLVTGSIIEPPSFLRSLLQSSETYGSNDFSIAAEASGHSLKAITSVDLKHIVQLAKSVSQNFPSIWFVNFPPTLSQSEVATLRRYQEDMLDFRSIASLKWWNEVYRRFPPDGTRLTEIRQSAELASVATRDMMETEWLLTTNPGTLRTYPIECKANELHGQLILLAMATFITLEPDSVRAIEPLLTELIRSVDSVTQAYNNVKTIITEKYQYVGDGRIKSYIRLICFQVKESFWDVQDGKDSSIRCVRCDVGFMDYEALFDVDAWEKYAQQIDDEQKDALKDFVKDQTLNVPV